MLRNLVRKSKINPSNILADIFDGSMYCSSDSITTIYLQLYIDEFEPCNALGVNRGNYKLSGVYFSILNLQRRFRYQDNAIFLALLCKYNYIKSTEEGYSILFKPLIDDLELLAKGIVLYINGHAIKYRAVLHLISADNLSAHDLGGYHMSFSCNNICRYCQIKYSNFRNEFSSENLNLITAENLNLIKHRKCPFQDLSYMSDKIHTLFPPDIMHDLMEGIIPLVLKLTIRYIVMNKCGSFEKINGKLKSLNFPANSNIPNLINSNILRDGSIIGSSSVKFELFLVASYYQYRIS